MYRHFIKMIIVVMALVLFVFPASGFASAHGLQSAHSASATNAQATSCGWVLAREWLNSVSFKGKGGTMDMKLWEYPCTGAVHCQVTSKDYWGSLKWGIDYGQENKETLYGGISPGASLNTDTYYYYDRNWSCTWWPN